MGKVLNIYGDGEWNKMMPPSEDGKTAYEIAVELGYVGSLEQWLSQFSGPIGVMGPAGAAGPAGALGANLIPGGAQSQVMMKASDIDYDVVWFSSPLISVGSAVDYIGEPNTLEGGLKKTYMDPSTGFVWETHTFNAAPGPQSLLANRPIVASVFGIAGGGGSGQGRTSWNYPGGYGGAGGAYLSASHQLSIGPHFVTVGFGGDAATSNGLPGSNGFDSVLDDITLKGGGGGSSRFFGTASNGGCGGGVSAYGGTPGLTIQTPPGFGYNAPGGYQGGGIGGGSAGLSLNLDGSGLKVYGQGFNGQNLPNSGSGATSTIGEGVRGADGIFVIKFRVG